MNVPKHIAVILDGNGRWAKSKGMPRNYGHVQGSKTVEDMCEIMYNRGVEYFTVYAFSTENWSRPTEEVELLMKLLRDYMKNCIKRATKNNMCCRVIGDKTKLAEDIRDSIEKLEEATKNNTGLKFTIAINYGSRDELRRATMRIAQKIENGEIKAEEITEEIISSELDTAGLPDPDLLIRTSGEQRISNFLLWQLAYTEFYFTPVYWPDFNKEELEKAIESYSNRNRRYGKI
ncbi:MAG: isoprenyl transferase [Lachnospiraceae bacterium]